ncbi:MAG: cation transporter [Erysipelotrichaceae bacterium]|nr:cation transporter [Erysipelotrichaceae bacterium]
MDKESISRKASIAGICVNIVLCTIKLISGFMTNSIAILSDGFNNLTDIGNAVLIFIGYRLASKPADREHPYGHGRIEYMLSQGIATVIIIVGFSLFKSSVSRIITPKSVDFNLIAVIILALSLAAKRGLAMYYNTLYKSSGLIPLKAQTTDSLSDAASTAVIIVGYLLTPLTSPYLDAILGLILSAVIMYNGVRIFLEMTSILTGTTGDKNTFDEVERILSEYPDIRGVHDLRIHSYGPDILYGSADIDLDAGMTLSQAHDILDAMETDVAQKTGIKMTLHADPSADDQHLSELKQQLTAVLKRYDQEADFHDFHYNRKLNRYIVDIVIPFDHKADKEVISELIRNALTENGEQIEIEIRFDRS